MIQEPLSREERTARRKARKAARLERIGRILAMRDEGHSTCEIAAEIGVGLNAAQMFVRRHLGVHLNRTKNRRLAAWATPETVAAFRAVAERSGRPVPDLVAALLKAAAADDARALVKLLGKDAMPPRRRVKAEKPAGPTKRELQREAKAKREAEAKTRKERERAAVKAVKRRIGR